MLVTDPVVVGPQSDDDREVEDCGGNHRECYGAPM